MKNLIKLFLVTIFFASSVTTFANPTSVSNNQLIHTNFVNKEANKASNPINLYGAVLFLGAAVCAYRFRKKII